MMMTRSLLLMALSCWVASCGTTEPNEIVELSELFDISEDGPAVVPDTVTVGVPFTVSVWTLMSTCEIQGETVVEMLSEISMEALVIPYTIYIGKRGNTGPCLTGGTAEHIATIQFNRVGLAKVFVRGNEVGVNPDRVYEVVVR